jgi:hypothetical protein
MLSSVVEAGRAHPFEQWYPALPRLGQARGRARDGEDPAGAPLAAPPRPGRPGVWMAGRHWLGEGRGHRDRVGWEHAPQGARHLRPHRGWQLGKPDRSGPGLPPPHRAAPGSPVYVIHAGDRAALVGEQDLTGPLRDLVTTILAAGDPPSRRSRSMGLWRRKRSLIPIPAGQPCTLAAQRHWNVRVVVRQARVVALPASQPPEPGQLHAASVPWPTSAG